MAVALLLGVAAPVDAKADGGLAVAAPLSGTYAELGEAISNAVQPATMEDDACQAEPAVAVAHKLVALRPGIVIGHPCSSAAIAAAPVYAAAGIPFIAVGARHGDLTDKRAGPNVFRLAGRDDQQGRVASDFLARAGGGRPIAILHDRTFAMSTIASDAAKALAIAHPGQPVQQFPFVASELDYALLVDKVAAFGAGTGGTGAILFAGYPSEAIVILKALRAKGVSAPLLGVDATATAEFGAGLADRRGEVFVLVSADHGADALAARASAAARLARDAMRTGASIQTGAFEDPQLGRIVFDAKGDAQLPSYQVNAWIDGAWKPIAASGDAIPLP